MPFSAIGRRVWLKLAVGSAKVAQGTVVSLGYDAGRGPCLAIRLDSGAVTTVDEEHQGKRWDYVDQGSLQ